MNGYGGHAAAAAERGAFRGKLAFITGGASGIGLAVARELASREMRVVLADVDRTALAEAGASVAGARTAVLDVRDREQWQAALDEAEAAFGPLAVLVSNAGVFGARLPITEVSPEAWNWIMGVNLQGVYHSLNLGVPRLLRTGGPAHVIVTASLSAMLMQGGIGAYSASKAAVVALCETLRDELKDTPVNVSVLLPAHVRTAIIEANPARAPRGVAIGERDRDLEAAVRAGLDPSVVARQVADALGTDRFWLFTHPELREQVARRATEIDAAMVGRF